MKKLIIIMTTFLMLMMLTIPTFASDTNILTISTDSSLGSYVIGAVEDSAGKKYNFTLDETNGFEQKIMLADGEYELSYANILVGEGSIMHCQLLESQYAIPKTVVLSSSDEQLSVEFTEVLLQENTKEDENKSDDTQTSVDNPQPPVIETVGPLAEIMEAITKLMPLFFFVILTTLIGIVLVIKSIKDDKKEAKK